MCVDVEMNEWLNSFTHEFRDKGFIINDDGDLCKTENDKTIRLSNFIIRPLMLIQRVSESGELEDYKYVFEGVLKKERRLKQIEIQASHLINKKWIKEWDLFCELYPNENYSYRKIIEYIYEFRKNIKTVIEYDTIGWHQYDNKWFFLHSDGTIGNNSKKFKTTNTQFVFKTDNALSAKESFLESLKMLDICDHKLSYSLLSFLLTSIITTPLLDSKELSPNYLLWIVGHTGYGKTTISTFFTNIYTKTNLTRPDAHKTKELLPGIKEHKDCILVIDDFGTSKTKQNEYSVIGKVEDIVRNLTDRQFSYNNISNGMVLITGEKFLDSNTKNESTKKRIIRVKMDNLFNLEDQGTYEAQKAKKYRKYKDQLFLPTSIVHYLHWLCEKLNLGLIDDYKKDFTVLRKKLGEKHNAHGRLTDSIAHQICAFKLYLTYGMEKRFITSDELSNYNEYAKQVFGDLLEDQNKEIFDPQVELFLHSLNKLIFSDKIVVEFNQSSLNFNRNVYGVVRKEKDHEVLKLHWETVYSLVSEYVENSLVGRKLTGKTKLARLLNEYNLICFNKGDTATPFKAWNNDKQESSRVINFKTSMIPDIMKTISLKEKTKKFLGSDPGILKLLK